jgi:ABC-type cobalamin/Fe3+-siderophores transport system ATPase subunit
MHHSIELVDIHICLGNVPILSGVNVEAKPCEFVAIVGANGSGKTTLLKIANGTLRPDRGTVKVLGHDFSNYKDLDFLRRDIGVVPQQSNHHRFPIRVEEAVLMGRFGKIGMMRSPQAIDREKAREAMRIAGILPLAEKLVFELSGGEQQKVALARALAQEPSILLLDEPTTYLDRSSGTAIMETIHAIHHERQLTTLMISHDSYWVEQYSDKIYLLKEGRSFLNPATEKSAA